MTIYWLCRTCGASGEGDRPAEQHVRDTRHTTETSSRPRTPEQQQSADKSKSEGSGDHTP